MEGLAELGEHAGLPASVQGFPSPSLPCLALPSLTWMHGSRGVRGVFLLEVTEWMKTHVEKEVLGAEDHTHIQTIYGIPGIVINKTFKNIASRNFSFNVQMRKQRWRGRSASP